MIGSITVANVLANIVSTAAGGGLTLLGVRKCQALNCIVTDDEVEIAVDTAAIRLDGVYSHDVDKCVTLPAKRLAVAARRYCGIAKQLARILDRFDTYAAAEAGLGPALDRCSGRRFSVVAGAC